VHFISLIKCIYCEYPIIYLIRYFKHLFFYVIIEKIHFVRFQINSKFICLIFLRLFYTSFINSSLFIIRIYIMIMQIYKLRKFYITNSLIIVIFDLILKIFINYLKNLLENKFLLQNDLLF